MEIVNEKAQAYAEAFTTPENGVRKELLEQTLTGHSQAHMLSGHLQGKFLEMISFAIRPERILEIGSFVGHSALCLAAGLAKEGQLHTIELREEDADIARNNFNKANMAGQIILHVGNALTIIPLLKEVWDLVFIDADKTGYLEYYELVLPAVRKGGFILADNVLFHGEVLKTEITGKNPKAIQAFNEHVNKDSRVEKVLLPFRDGLYMIRKC